MEANEQNPYDVAIVKEQLGVLRIMVMRMGQLVGCSLFLQWSGNIECTITEARHYSSDLS